MVNLNSLVDLEIPAKVKETVSVPEMPVLPKLSELIREGCKYTRPGEGYMYHESDFGAFACALGAGVIGAKRLGFLSGPINYLQADDLGNAIGVDLFGTLITHPEAPNWSFDLASIIISLNDRYDWPREKIADWLQSIGY